MSFKNTFKNMFKIKTPKFSKAKHKINFIGIIFYIRNLILHTKLSTKFFFSLKNNHIVLILFFHFDCLNHANIHFKQMIIIHNYLRIEYI